MAPGLMEGNVASLGEYDECLRIKSPPKDEDGSVIRGQYCTGRFHVPHPNYESFNASEPLPDYIPVQGRKLVPDFVYGLSLQKYASYHLGMCIPSTCRGEDIAKVLTKCKTKQHQIKF